MKSVGVGGFVRAGRWGGLIALILVTATGLAARGQDRERIHNEIRRLQDKKVKLERQVTRQREKVESVKSKKISKSLAMVTSSTGQKEIGTKFAEVLGRHLSNGTDVPAPRKILEELEKELKSKLGGPVYAAAARQLEDMVAILMEDGSPPTPIRCARAFKEACEGSFDVDSVEAAWPKLKPHVREARKLDALVDDLKALDREIDSLQRQLTSDIRGEIPRGMAPIPGAKNAELGISTKQIETLAEANAETLKSNKFLFLGSQTEKKSVSSFLIDQYEVTHLMYWYFCEKTGHRQPEFFAGTDPRTKKKIVKPVWIDGKIPPGWEKRPISYVNLEDALAYAEWTGCRLPTEDEWEVAARSGRAGYDGRIWPWGSKYERHLANDNQAHDLIERRRTAGIIPKDIKLPAVLPVGSFDQGATPLGIHDLAGNVAEWTTSHFLPRSTFQPVVEGMAIPNEFNEDLVVARGGHCDQRDLIVNSVMRVGAHPQGRFKYVGFRRARSGVPGLDLLARLGRHSALDAVLQTFKLQKLDKKNKWPIPRLDQTSGRFAVREKLDWNDQLQVPGEAHSILVANRAMKLGSLAELKRMSDGDDDRDDACLFGILYTDEPVVEPALEPGIWFVAFKEGRKVKDEKTGKRKKIKDAFLFIPKRLDRPIVRMEASGDEVIVLKQSIETRLEVATTDGLDQLEAIWSFPKSRRQSLVITLPLKFGKGKLAAFK